jgi:hypothetical protein
MCKTKRNIVRLSFIPHPISGVKTLILSVPDNEVIEIMTSSFHLVFGTIFPFTTITISNIIIITTVKRASKNRLKMDAKTDNISKDRQKAETQHLTRMLICVCIGYVVTSLPFRFHYLILGIPEVGLKYDMTKPYWNLRYIGSIIIQAIFTSIALVVESVTGTIPKL